MEISKEKLIREATNTGFRPDILEKVWRLMAILDGINLHPFLKDRLVLKGGTALNLFFFDLPRLSIDIDLNYVGNVDREAMLVERPQVEEALERIFQQEGLSIRRIPKKHAGGKWQLRYASALGSNGNLDVDLNFMFRTPLYTIQRQCSHEIGTQRTKEVALLDLHELGAGKLSALFARRASRDLFDTHQLLTKCSLDIEQLRLAGVVYGAMGSRDWRDISIDELDFEEKELKDQLIPVLKKEASHTHNNDWLSFVHQLLVDCKTALKKLFPLRENEKIFLQQLFEHGKIEASLLTQDRDLIKKIHSHPLLQWKVKCIIDNR